MADLLIPCHACGFENPISASFCLNSNCKALIRLPLRPTATTQCMPANSTVTLVSDEELVQESAGNCLTASPDGVTLVSDEELVQEAFLVVHLLMQSAHRLRVLIDQARKRIQGE